MLPRRTQLIGMVVAAALGGGTAVAAGCGDRQSTESSNPGLSNPNATPATTETNPNGLTPTGASQPSVTQPPTTTPTSP